MPKASSTRRILAHYDFEGGSSVELAVIGAVDTPTAVSYATRLLKLKEEELRASEGKRPLVTPLKAAG